MDDPTVLLPRAAQPGDLPWANIMIGAAGCRAGRSRHVEMDASATTPVPQHSPETRRAVARRTTMADLVKSREADTRHSGVASP